MSHQRDPRCTELFALLSEYVDGELPSPVREELEAHFADCPPCVQFLRQFKNSVHLTRGYCTEQLPSPLPAPLKNALERAWRMSLDKIPLAER